MSDQSVKPSAFFCVPFRTLKIIGLWQDENSSWQYQVYGFTHNFISVQIHFLFSFLYLFHYENFYDLTDCIAIFSTICGEILKTTNFVRKLQVVIKLVDSLEALMSEFGNNHSHERIAKHVKLVGSVYKILLTLGVVSCIQTGLISLLNVKDHTLSYRMYYPFIDYQNNDTWFIILALFQLTSISACTMVLTLDCLPVFFMAYATGLLEELSDRLALVKVRPSVAQITADPTLIKPQSNEEDLMEILKCIEIHQKIKNLVADVQKSFSFVIFIQGLISSVIFCAVAYLISMVRMFIILKREQKL